MRTLSAGNAFIEYPISRDFNARLRKAALGYSSGLRSLAVALAIVGLSMAILMSSDCNEREACSWLIRSCRACRSRLTATPTSATDDMSVESTEMIAFISPVYLAERLPWLVAAEKAHPVSESTLCASLA